METPREDIRNYSTAELSLRVYNDEFLYSAMQSGADTLFNTINSMFIYSSEQLQELEHDLKEDGYEFA